MNTQPEELRDRSKAFALRVIRLFRTLPYRTDTQVLGKQLLRCGTAVADEAVLWLELLTESGIISAHKTDSLLAEARELAAIFTASQQTAKKAA